MKVAVVGATGLVGGIMCKVLEERNFPVTQFIPVASERSVGKEVWKRPWHFDQISSFFEQAGLHRWNGHQHLRLQARPSLITLRHGA